MSILSDSEIKELCISDEVYNMPESWKPMIVPFVDHQVRYKEKKSTIHTRIVGDVGCSNLDTTEKIISFGLSSYGYDLRIADEFKIFTNINSTCVDPKNFDPKSFVDFVGDVCIIPPNSFVLARSVEYFNMPNDVTALLACKSTYARTGLNCPSTVIEAGWCFTGDTKVALVNGESISFIDLVEGHAKGKRFFGYTFMTDGSIGVEELLNPRKIQENANLLEIVLDNGESIKCTPDHKFLLKDGTYIEASELKENDSLMPLYRYSDKKGYESVGGVIMGKTRPIYTHKLSDEWNIRNNIYNFIPSMVRHHIDFNPRNNDPRNIVRMTDAEHHFVHEQKEGYIEERKKIGMLGYEAFIANQPTHAIIKEIMSDRSKVFWENAEHADTRKEWLEKHKVPRKIFTCKDIYEALKNNRSLNGAARFLKITTNLLYRRFSHLIALARTEGFIPTNHKVVSVNKIEETQDVYCLEVPNTNNFALDAGIFVHNCGNVTLEFANTSTLPVKLYANEGACQLLFFKGAVPPNVSYADRNGKYMHQKGITLPRS